VQNVSGPQQATIAFEAHSQHLQPGRVHEAILKITANAGQVLQVPVRLEVRRPVMHGDRRAARPILIGAVAGLVFRLLLILPADLVARLWMAPVLRSDPPEFMNQFARNFVLITWWVGAIMAAGLLWRRGNRRADLVYGLITGAVAGLVASAT